VWGWASRPGADGWAASLVFLEFGYQLKQPNTARDS
jgi:hypothetical protein